MRGHGISGTGVDRKHKRKWLFPLVPGPQAASDLFSLFILTEDFFLDNTLGRFVQVLVEGGLDLQELRPQGLVQETTWGLAG